MSNFVDNFLSKSHEEQEYILKYLPSMLFEAKKESRLREIMFNSRYLELRILNLGVDFVIRDVINYKHIDNVLSILHTLMKNRDILSACSDHDELVATLYSCISFVSELSQMAEVGLNSWNKPLLTFRVPPSDNTNHKSLITVLVGHAGPISDCAISRDKSTIVSASDDYTVKIWDTDTGLERVTIDAHTDEVICCAINGDGRFVISSSANGCVIVSNTLNGKTIMKIDQYKAKRCDIDDAGERIVFFDRDNQVYVWDIFSKKELTTFHPDHFIDDCAISPDGSFVITTSSDADVKIWTSVSGHKITEAKPKNQIIPGARSDGRCSISHNGSFAVTCSQGFDSILWVWNLKDILENKSKSPLALPSPRAIKLARNYLLRLPETSHRAQIEDCSICDDGSIAVCGFSIYLNICNIDLKKFSTKLAHKRPLQSGLFGGGTLKVTCCDISADGTMAVSGNRNGLLSVWNLKSINGKNGQKTVMGGEVRSKITRDGAKILTASEFYGDINIFNAATGQHILSHSIHSDGWKENELHKPEEILRNFSIDQSGKSAVLSFYVHDENTTKLSFVRINNQVELISSLDLPFIESATMHKNGAFATISFGKEKGTYFFATQKDSQSRLVDPKINDLDLVDISFSDNGLLFSSVDGRRVCALWDLRTETILDSVTCHGPLRCAINADGTVVAILTEKKLYLWFPQRKNSPLQLLADRSFLGCSLNAQGNILTAISLENSVIVWNTESLQKISSMRFREEITTCDISGSGENLVVSGGGGFYSLKIINYDKYISRSWDAPQLEQSSFFLPPSLLKASSDTSVQANQMLYTVIELVVGLSTGIAGAGWVAWGKYKRITISFWFGVSVLLAILSVVLAYYSNGFSLCCTVPFTWFFIIFGSSAALRRFIQSEARIERIHT